jgi:excisionase family DNA binding protein
MNTLDDSLLTKRALAPRLNCSVRTIDEWMRRGRLPYLKLGKAVRFRWGDVLAKLGEFRVN